MLNELLANGMYSHEHDFGQSASLPYTIKHAVVLNQNPDTFFSFRTGFMSKAFIKCIVMIILF